MNCARGLLVLGLCTGLQSAVVAAPTEQASQDAAIAAAEQWLSLIDGGDYGRSHEQAAAYFKNAVTPEQWTQSLTALRQPMGRVNTRTRTDAQSAAQAPGAPDGQYVILTFQTSLENKQQAVETVTLSQEADGTWRVAGYFIR